MISGSSTAIRVSAGSGTPSAWKPDRGRVGGDPCFDVEGRRSHGQVEERALAVAEIVETALAARLIGMEAFAAPLASFGAIAVGE